MGALNRRSGADQTGLRSVNGKINQSDRRVGGKGIKKSCC